MFHEIHAKMGKGNGNFTLLNSNYWCWTNSCFAAKENEFKTIERLDLLKIHQKMHKNV